MKKYYESLEDAVQVAMKDEKAVQRRMPNSPTSGMFYAFLGLFGYTYKRYFIDYKNNKK